MDRRDGVQCISTVCPNDICCDTPKRTNNTTQRAKESGAAQSFSPATHDYNKLSHLHQQHTTFYGRDRLRYILDVVTDFSSI